MWSLCFFDAVTVESNFFDKDEPTMGVGFGLEGGLVAFVGNLKDNLEVDFTFLCRGLRVSGSLSDEDDSFPRIDGGFRHRSATCRYSRLPTKGS